MKYYTLTRYYYKTRTKKGGSTGRQVINFMRLFYSLAIHTEFRRSRQICRSNIGIWTIIYFFFTYRTTSTLYNLKVLFITYRSKVYNNIHILLIFYTLPQYSIRKLYRLSVTPTKCQFIRVKICLKN